MRLSPGHQAAFVTAMLFGVAFFPRLARASEHRVCPFVDLDFDDSGNGENRWDQPEMWALDVIAGMGMEVLTFQVVEGGGSYECNWDVVVSDQWGFADAEGCSDPIETGHDVVGCFAVVLYSFGDPDLTVGDTGVCSDLDPGCNLIVRNGEGWAESSVRLAAGYLPPGGGDIGYYHDDTPESIQTYVTLADAYRRFGRNIGAGPGGATFLRTTM